MDTLSMSIGVLLVIPLAIVGFYIIAYLKNKNRYAIPRFLPRGDEVLWAQVVANQDRIWCLPKTAGLKCISWDFGIFSFYNPKYNTTLTIGDVIIAPKKWGGWHALVVIENISPEKVKAIYVGEFIYESRKRNPDKDSRIISFV